MPLADSRQSILQALWAASAGQGGQSRKHTPTGLERAMKDVQESGPEVGLEQFPITYLWGLTRRAVRITPLAEDNIVYLVQDTVGFLDVPTCLFSFYLADSSCGDQAGQQLFGASREGHPLKYGTLKMRYSSPCNV